MKRAPAPEAPRPAAPASAAPAIARPHITAEETRLLAELIVEHCGISLGSDAGFLFERRLGPRLDALSLTTFLEYYHHLSYDLDAKIILLQYAARISRGNR